MPKETVASHLPPYRVRPRFKIDVPFSMTEVSDKIILALNKTQNSCIGQSKPGYITLYVPEKEQHYWSPQLNITMDENESGCTLRGLYGPRPTVWTMFVFFYALIGFATLIIGMVGLSRISLDKSGAILWLIPLLIVVIATLWLVSYYGQKLGENQMITLHKFLEDSLDMTIDASK